MANGDGLIDPNSENVVDDTAPFDPYFFEAADTNPDQDLVFDHRDETRYGIDSALLTELEAAQAQAQANLLQTTLDDAGFAALQARLRYYSANPPKASLRDPYEFLFRPISGNNAVGLPKQGFLLPLPPEKFEVKQGQDARTYTSINQQEFSLPGARELATIQLEGMFPYVHRSGGGWGAGGKPNYLPGYITTDNFVTPNQGVARFRQLMMKAQPVRLTIGPPKNAPDRTTHPGGLVGRAMNFTVVDFQYGEAFGHPGSYVWSMELLQWLPTYPPRNKTNNPPAAASVSQGPVIKPPPLEPPKPKVYTIKSGDTLWDIAARFLGSGTDWPRIYNLNKKTIEDECKRRGSSCYPRGWHIWPGTKLKIPDKKRKSA